MHQPRFSFLAPVAFATALVAANTGCIINANDLGFTDEECADLAELCPALNCELGNVEDGDGCPICECKSPDECDQDQVAIPDGCENPRFNDAECAWSCQQVEPTGCLSDADCGDGFFCAFVGTAEAPDDGNGDRAAPAPEGQCLPRNQEGDCNVDSDCAAGERCVFDRETDASYCIISEEQPCFSDAECHVDEVCDFSGSDGAAQPREDVAIAGQCIPAPQTACTSDEDCREGTHCETFEAPNGLVAPSEGVCVVNPIESCFSDVDCLRGQRCDFEGSAANALILLAGTCVDASIPVSECSTDADCNGGTCETTCVGDPNCPNCDVCFEVGTCRYDDVPCFDDSACAAGQHCEIFFNNEPALQAPPCDPTIDRNCGADPLPPGLCVDDQLPACASDADCGRGEYCDISTTPGNALIACEIDEETGGCLPPRVDGVCRPIDDNSCTSDFDCNRGEFCSFGNAQRPAPCDPATGANCETFEGTCQPLPAQECFSDEECGTGFYCDYGFGPPLPIPALLGTCQPIDDTAGCQADTDCAEGQICAIFEDCACTTACLDADDDGQCDPCVCDERPAFVGTCIDVIVDETCFSDADCGPGQVCEFGAIAGRRPCPAFDADGNCIAPPQETGVCVDVPTEPTICTSDDQCSLDQVCVFDDGSTEPGDANRPGRTGVCKSRIDTNPCATLLCSTDTICVVDADGQGRCVADERTVCLSDSECADGRVCNAGNGVCNSDPSCRPGENCPDVCYGFCVAEQLN